MQANELARCAQAAGRIDVSRFPACRMPQLALALRYLGQSPVMRTAVRRLHVAGNIVFIEYHPAHTKFLFRNPGNLRIQWNPCLGLRDVTGYLTPALLLGHELGHAQFTAQERCAMLECERPQGFQQEVYGVEEAHVIAAIEQPAVVQLNAARIRSGLGLLETATRVQHQLGRLVEVSGPLSSRPAACD
jgi:hypothetical protein